MAFSSNKMAHKYFSVDFSVTTAYLDFPNGTNSNIRRHDDWSCISATNLYKYKVMKYVTNINDVQYSIQLATFT